MKVVTENPIIIQKGDKLDPSYSAAGKGAAKVKDFVTSGKAAGVLSALSTGGPNIAPSSPSPLPSKKTMSTGVKVGIAIGAVALVGVIIYMVKKKK